MRLRLYTRVCVRNAFENDIMFKRFRNFEIFDVRQCPLRGFYNLTILLCDPANITFYNIFCTDESTVDLLPNEKYSRVKYYLGQLCTVRDGAEK